MELVIEIVPGVRWHSVRVAATGSCGGASRAFWATDDPREPVRLAALLRVHAPRAGNLDQLCASIPRPPMALVPCCEVCCARAA